MPKPRPKKKRHVIAWLRETLSLTQRQFATEIGSSQPTIQAIELGRIPLSDRFAYAIEAKTGMSAKWLLKNQLEPLPDVAQVLERYESAKQGWFKYTYEGHLLPRLVILRTGVALVMVADELGYSGAKAAGCYTLLDKISSDFIQAIGDLATRRRVYARISQLLTSNDKVADFWRTAALDMKQGLKEIRQQRKEDEAIDDAMDKAAGRKTREQRRVEAEAKAKRLKTSSV